MHKKSRYSIWALLLAIYVLGISSLMFAQEKSGKSEINYEITQKEVRVPMADGTELWGCLTYPKAVDDGRQFPALLVFDPYAGDCSLTYYYEGPQAQKGYVVAYFHVRGTGRSEGTFFDREYSRQELDDAVQLIDWLASQSWSTGKVGMYGWSWSGFNALQVAMKKPEPLKAIIANVATENLYYEDVHYADGIFRYGPYNIFADLNLIYTPPPLDPTDDLLLAKRFAQPPLSLIYLKHQTDGPFWRKSIRLDEDPDTLQVPTYLMGGWYDGYRSAIARALKYAKAPTKAVIGPWAHNLEQPEPTADLTKLMVRWWDYWLKDNDTGVMEDPDLITYLRAPYLPSVSTDTIPGRWQKVDNWPSDRINQVTYYLSSDNDLILKKSEEATLKLRYVPTAGAEAGIWWGDVLSDQRAAEAHSLTFETEPFEQERAILGRPETKLWISAPARHANWIVRLSNVAPDGTVTRITGAAQNGTHRNSSVNPEYLEPGKVYKLSFPLHFTGWIMKPDHRLRISVSNATWPIFWPTPYSMTTSLFIGPDRSSSIIIPFTELNADSTSARLAELVGSRNIAVDTDSVRQLRKPPYTNWAGPDKIIRDEAKAQTTVIYSESDTTLNPQTFQKLVYKLSDYTPDSASVTGTSRIELEKDRDIFIWEGITTIRSDAENFYYRHVRTLEKNGKEIRRKVWDETIKRQFQ